MDGPRSRLGAYRRCDSSDEQLTLSAQRPLREACDALHLAILCLESQDAEDSPGARQRAAGQARSFLAEAVTALHRARIYVPEVFTYTSSVIAAGDADPSIELARLHQIATRLLWYNHSLLPARCEAPLRPEDEAQLVVFVRALARTTRAARALRHAWLAAVSTLAILLPFGPVAVAMGLASLFALACILQIVSALRAVVPSALPEQV